MARQDAFYEKHSLFINAALIAGHANHGPGSFRQKDIKFLIELLTNWMETSFKYNCLEVKNTQVQRLLDSLSKEGILKKNIKSSKPEYQFNSIGLLEIISRLVSDQSLNDLENFFFLYHFVSLYSHKMESLLFGERQSLPSSYQIEIKHLLNPANLVERQKRRVQLDIKKLQNRISEAYQMADLAKTCIDKGLTLKETILKIEARYPYQLNNQRKMAELFSTLSPDVQLIEISEAPKYRAQTLWEPLLKQHENYLDVLSKLK